MATLQQQPQLNWQSLDFTAMMLGWCTTVSFLLVYCLGHGALTAEPLLPLASFRWSLIHGTSVIVMLAVFARSTRMNRLLSGLVGWVAVLTISSLLSLLLTLDWQQLLAVHSYTSLTLTGLLAAIFSSLKKSCHPDPVLKVDVRGISRAVPVSQIIAAHAHRNYIELELDTAGDNRATGLIRMTIKALLKQTGNQMIQVHRSHLVNPAFIKCSNRDATGKLRLHLKNGTSVPVSNTQRTQLNRLSIRP